MFLFEYEAKMMKMMKIVADEDDDEEAVEVTTVIGWSANYIVVVTKIKQTLFALWKGYYYFLGIIWYGNVLKVIGVVAPLPSTWIYKANLSEISYCEKYFSIS